MHASTVAIDLAKGVFELAFADAQGRIIERGSHMELLDKKGYYHELYSRQFEEEEAMKVFAGATFAGETDWESVCQP